LLYGTTYQGGSYDYGTVFRLDREGSSYAVIYSFGPRDIFPYEGVTEGPDGALYGSVREGGDMGFGALFRLSDAGALTVNADPGQCFASSVNLGTPLASDNCTLAGVTNDAPPVFPVGTTFVTWTATDASGNTATCAQRVVVKNATPPTITCPADISVTATGPTGAEVQFVATASDACAGIVPVFSTPPTGSLFPVGTNTVLCWAVDPSGNSNSCSFTVTVLGATPTIAVPPQITDGNFVVRFAGTPTATYAIETVTNLDQGNWENLTNITASPSGDIELTIPVNSAPMRFFRAIPVP
jgi:uncharacterized repeat protein (TIGR03803 family)